MGKWMSAVRIASTSGIALFCATQLLPQDPGYEVSTGQTEPVEALPRFVLGGRMDVLTIESRYRILSCCLDYDPVVEVTGNVVRVTERDLGPACDCADVGWDLQVEVRGLPPADYEVFIDDQAGGLIATARVTVPASETALFVRGRVNGDSAVDISDAWPLWTTSSSAARA
jgi:hypothetical protein